MNDFFEWYRRCCLNRDTTTTVRRRKIKQLRKALKRLSNIMQRAQPASTATGSKKSKREKEFFDDFFTSAFSANQQNLGFLPTEAPMSTVATVSIDNICDDIRGRDRACCNSAVSCFDDLQSSLDEIGQAQNDYSLLSACRRVSSELKKDKQCVKQSVSRCDGSGRALLLRRFNNRISKLYDQFYRHCSPDAIYPTTTTTTTTQEPETFTNGSSTSRGTPPKVPAPPTISSVPVTDNNTPTISGHLPNHGDQSGNSAAPTSGSIAIIAGALSGGIILIIVLLIGLVLWCRNRDKTYDSNGTNSSSAGIFFQKKPNMFSTDRPRANGKRGVKRQESSEYAEIDERFMNPGFRPPAPPLPGESPQAYLRPISEVEYTEVQKPNPDIHPSPPGTPDSLKGLGFSAPAVATRGQLKYGPILAANANGQPPLYPPSALTSNHHQILDDLRNDKMLSAESFDEDDYLAPSSTGGSANRPSSTGGSANRYITMDVDQYELPNSARSSVNYDQIEHDTSAKNDDQAPPRKDSEGPHRHSAVKVLPSNPLSVPLKDSDKTVPRKDSESSVSKCPVAKPRRKKQSEQESQDNVATDQDVSNATEETNTHQTVSPTKSNNSSHHYFVLEPHPV